MSEPLRKLVVWSRTLHIYVSMLGLALLLFFAATGFMLNHPGAFGLEETHDTEITAEIPAALLEKDQRLALVEKLRAGWPVTGALDLDAVEDDDQQLLLPFYSPGRNCRVTVAKTEGSPAGRPMKIEIKSRGAMGRLADLHKGEHAGASWKRIIDGASILLAFASLSGITLLLALPRRRRLGLAALAVGLALSVAVYFVLVP